MGQLKMRPCQIRWLSIDHRMERSDAIPQRSILGVVPIGIAVGYRSIPGKIQLHYLDVDTGESFTGGTSATVGILPPRLDPSSPLLVSLNQTQPWIAAGESLQIELRQMFESRAWFRTVPISGRFNMPFTTSMRLRFPCPHFGRAMTWRMGLIPGCRSIK